MNCKECQDLYSDLKDRELSGARADQALAHLSDCAECGEGYRAYQRALGALGNEPLEAPPAGFAEGILRRLAGEASFASPGGLRPRASLRPRPGAEPRDRARVPGMYVRLARAFAAAALVAVLLLLGFALGRSGGAGSRLEMALAERAAALEAVARIEKELHRTALDSAAERRNAEAVLAAGEERAGILKGQVERLVGDLAALTAGNRSLAAEVGEVRGALETARRESDALRGDVERLGRRATDRPIVERPRERPAAGGSRQVASAVALDRRRGGGGEIAIDLHGPDSRVVPELLALAGSEDEELGNLALRLLRERMAVRVPAERDSPSPEEAPARPLFHSVGLWLGDVTQGMGLSAPHQPPPRELPSDVRRQEVERYERLWRLVASEPEAEFEKL